MYKHIAASIVALLAAASSHAGVVTVWGEELSLFSKTTVNSFYNNNGHTSTIATGQLDTINLSGVNLLWATQPADTYTAGEISSMQSYLNGGGRIAFLGEHGTFGPAQNNRINAAISALGGNIIINNDLHDAGFRSASKLDGQISTNSLTAGVNTYEYAAYAPLTLGGGAEALMIGEEFGTVMMAYEVIGNGSIFLITDQNVWDHANSSWGSFDNETMFLNLVSATVPGLPPPGGSAVPEPSTYGLIGAAALVGIVALRRKKAKK